MKIVRSAHAAADLVAAHAGRSVVTIGNFDGVHLGHQAMIRAARQQADILQLPLVVLSFDPHPENYFAPEKAPPRLSSLGERVMMLQSLNVDIACIMPFNRNLASLSHGDFVSRILRDQLRAACVVIGDDFHYGAGRRGNAQTLQAAAPLHDFEVVQLHSVMENTDRVSSTHIRRLLQNGDLDHAAMLLGRQYSIMGRVIRGDARGRTWGFPTLNLPIQHRRALRGVFAVKVRGLGEGALEGVANLGTRPTVDGLKSLLETHLFEYSGDAYGQRICVDFYHPIRRERKFDSFAELKVQISRDIEAAKQYFGTQDAATTQLL